MSSEIAIRVTRVSKAFKIYTEPGQRLRQMLWNGLARVAPGYAAQHLRQRAHQQAGDFWALRDVSFEVARGQTVGIIGRNGSGKSTLLQIICGTLTPTSGQVEVNGRVAALLELGSGFNPEYTGRENIYFNAQLLGLTKSEVDARLDDIIGFADIGEFLDQPVKSYSSGMFVRLAFAVIAHVDADVLVIDEALAVGDAFFTQKCMRFLRQFMQKNTVLFVSHDTSSVKSLCSHAIWLEKGQILEQGSPKDIADLYLQAFYEAQQGKSTKTIIKPEYVKRETRPKKDQRLQFINQTNLRNDIQLFDFNPNAASFGKGGATIVNVALSDTQGHPLTWMVGGEEVRLSVTVMANADLHSPIVGFYVKDQLGQNLFGDNTYITTMDAPIRTKSGQWLTAEFCFSMPLLAKGDYSVCVAVAEGTQDTHEQQHWIHDALMFRSESTSVASGLLGIPMSKVSLASVQQENYEYDTHLRLSNV